MFGNGPFFRRTVRASDGSSIAVFVAQDFIPLLNSDGVMLMADSTYKTVPSIPGAYQLFSIHAVEYEEESAEVSFILICIW